MTVVQGTRGVDVREVRGFVCEDPFEEPLGCFHSTRADALLCDFGDSVTECIHALDDDGALIEADLRWSNNKLDSWCGGCDENGRLHYCLVDGAVFRRWCSPVCEQVTAHRVVLGEDEATVTCEQCQRKTFKVSL